MTSDTAYLAYDYARFYDWNYQGFLDDLPCYITLARRYGPRLLELACGTGRLTIPLAREGFAVTGLDLSPEMLRIAERKLEREPPEVRERRRGSPFFPRSGDLTALSSSVGVPYRESTPTRFG